MKGFIISVRNELEANKKAIHLGVYSPKGGFIMIKIQYEEYTQWKKKGRGMLGCELA